MKTRFFFVIYLHDKILKAFLDCIRLVADSNQKNFSHITVKGPYKTSQKKLLSEDNDEIIGEEIRLVGAGVFFEEKQNTVFFKCEENRELYKIWKKKDERTYKEFHPHLTIYDGENRNFAVQLLNVIDSHNINIGFTIDKLEIYSTRDKDKLFNLRTSVDYKMLSEIAKLEINESNIDFLNDFQRLNIIDSLCTELEFISTHKDFHFSTKIVNDINLPIEM